MLRAVARIALPREQQRRLPLLVLLEPILSKMNLFLFPPSALAKRAARCVSSAHLIRGCATPPRSHRGCSSREHEVSELAGSRAGSIAWLPGGKSSISLQPFYRNPGGYSPQGDVNVRSTCEMSPKLPGEAGVGLAVNITLHSSGTFWGRITHNELMLTHKVPETCTQAKSPSLATPKDSVVCDCPSLM